MKRMLFTGIALLVLASVATAACPPQCVLATRPEASKPGCKCGKDCTCKPGKRADSCKCGPGCPCARSRNTSKANALNGITINGQPTTIKRGLFGRLRAVPDRSAPSKRLPDEDYVGPVDGQPASPDSAAKGYRVVPKPDGGFKLAPTDTPAQSQARMQPSQFRTNPPPMKQLPSRMPIRGGC